MKARNREEIFLKALADGKEPEIKPLTRKEVLLKKQSKRESEGPHWNDIEGKPFGETVEVVELIPEQTLTSRTESYGTVFVLPFDYENLNMEDFMSREKILTVNGVKYKGKFTEDGEFVDDNGENISIDIYVEEWGESRPFKVVEGGLVYESGTIVFDIVVSCSEVSETIKTIDPKYLPKDVGGVNCLFFFGV